MNWQPDALWSKSKLYMDRALAEDRDDPLFAFWCSLALEFLTRAAIATVHPVLLAEPEANMQNVLYALGQPAPKKGAKSVTTSTVLSLCKQLVPKFGPDEATLCEALSNRRNEELHSGGMPFDQFKSAEWMSRFYATAKVLLEFQKRNFEDFLGESEARIANQMISATEAAIIEKVKRSISAHKTIFDEKDAATKTKLAAENKTQADLASHQGGHRVNCPACGCQTWVTGERISYQGTKVDGDGNIVEREAMLPTAFECKACGLKFIGHSELHVAGIGGQFTHSKYFDPVDYYGASTSDAGPFDEYDNE